MYKVFLNEKSILIVEDINNADIQRFDHVVFFAPGMPLRREFENFVNNQCRNMLILADDSYEEACNSFTVLFTSIKAAGGIVRNKDSQLLFITRHGIPDLPKGKLSKGESPQAAALREVEEETGLHGLAITKPIRSTFHLYNDRHDNPVLKETFWFEMRYSGSEIPCPQAEENITDAFWATEKEAKDLSLQTYGSLRELIDYYLSNS